MAAVIDQLEDRVNAVADVVRQLRLEIARLERELAECHPPAPPSPSPPTTPAPAAPEKRLNEEVTQLRQQRAAVRERIRALIREIDQVSW